MIISPCNIVFNKIMETGNFYSKITIKVRVQKFTIRH